MQPCSTYSANWIKYRMKYQRLVHFWTSPRETGRWTAWSCRNCPNATSRKNWTTWVVIFIYNFPSNSTSIFLVPYRFQSASGTGLAFIIFTEAINQFPGAQFWSVLFFLMLFTLGIDSQFGTLEGVVTSIVDMKLFPNLRKEILTGL